MFERYTDRARRVIVLSQEEARRLGHTWIGTEHLLLGLTGEETGIAAKVLQALGIELDAAREEVVQIIGRGDTTNPESGHIPFTPRTKKVLEMAPHEAAQLGHNYIGTEHLLLALLREGDGVGAQILSSSGIDVARALPQITQLMHSAPEEGRATAGPLAGPMPGPTPGPRAGRAGAGDAVANRLASIEARLTAIERRLGESAPGAGG